LGVGGVSGGVVVGWVVLFGFWRLMVVGCVEGCGGWCRVCGGGYGGWGWFGVEECVVDGGWYVGGAGWGFGVFVSFHQRKKVRLRQGGPWSAKKKMPSNQKKTPEVLFERGKGRGRREGHKMGVTVHERNLL